MMLGKRFQWTCRVIVHERQSYARRLRQLAVGALLLVMPTPSKASPVTSIDNYRVAIGLVAKVRQFYHPSISPQRIKELKRKETVQPRHVLLMARTALRKANTLALINSMETLPLGPMPTQSLRPRDVSLTLGAIAWVIEGMKPIFGVQTEIASARVNESKTPNDVYAVIYELSHMIDGLGIPRSVPNDIYPLAQVLTDELSTLAHRTGLHHEPLRTTDRRKNIQDVYYQVFATGEALTRLVEDRADLRPYGGTIRPLRRPGVINADQVIYALNDLIADVVAMRAITGLQGATMAQRLVKGKKPSDVFQLLLSAQDTIEALANAG